MDSMETKQKLEAALKDAMRSHNDVAKRTLRVALSSIKLAEVEKGALLDDQAVTSILQKEIKGRKESIQDAQRANRPDLVTAFQEDIAFLEGFLPTQISSEELENLARAAVRETGAHTPADMGKVMKALMPRVAGRAAGDQVSQVVKQILAGS